MSPQDARAETGLTLIRKLMLSSAIGVATFVGSALLDGPFDVPLPDQLLLTTIVGGITLLAQFLVDFEARLYSLEEQQRLNVEEAKTILRSGFSRTNEATRILNSDPLVRDLAGHQIERLSTFLRDLSVGAEVFYDGEDREWLLGLAHRSRQSIMATSLATVDAGGAGFEGGLWKNDLGSRYLELQREAIKRGVKIRRIFVFDRPEFLIDPDFVTVRNLQADAGIEVRVLENRMVPNNLKGVISDFVVFDGTIVYETTPATHMDADVKPAILTTRLVLAEDRVTRRAARFEELWNVAESIST